MGRNNKKPTIEEVKQFVEIDSKSGCKLLSDIYVNCETPLHFVCACGNEFKTEYTKFVSQNKRQCNDCGKGNISKKQAKTHDQFIQEIYDLVGNEYIVLSEYKNTHTHIQIKHETCSYEYPVLPSNFLRGKRCPKCNGGSSRSHDEFVKQLYDICGDEYQLISEYKRSAERIMVRHTACGFEYPVFPYAILGGATCPWCSGLYQDTNRFKQWVFEHYEDEYQVLGEYKKATVKIKMFHKKCDREFYTTPNDFKNNGGCNKCKQSKGEVEIEKYLRFNEINYVPQYRIKECRNKRALPFDFAIFNDNKLLFLIEFQGRQHYDRVAYRIGSQYSDLEYIQNNDKIKKEYCKHNNIKLLEIPYWDKNNIPKILDNFLFQFNLTKSA